MEPIVDAADVVIRNGTVVHAHSTVRADIVVNNGRIRAVVESGSSDVQWSGALEIDATGKLVLPGGVDPHCHVGYDDGHFVALDDYRQATEAAVFGGTTTIVDFAIPGPEVSAIEAARSQQAKSTEGLCDSALHACVIDWDPSIPEQLHELAGMGIFTVKMYTTNRGETMATDDTIFKVMKELGKLGGLAYVHCESNHIIEERQAECAEHNRISARFLSETRPMIAELSAVASTIAMAEALGTPVYLVHQSTAVCLELAAAARRRGVAVFSEAVTHHLVLDEEVYDGPHPERYACCPPLRSHAQVDRLTGGLWNGTITTVASDHCCYDTAQKLSRRDDVRSMPQGLPGVEFRMPVLFGEFVSKRGLSVERFVELCCENPARANGIYPEKGAILPGSDADIVIWDPLKIRVIQGTDLHMATDYSPYDGLEIVGWPETAFVRGHVVLDRGNLADSTARGRSVRARPMHFSGT